MEMKNLLSAHVLEEIRIAVETRVVETLNTEQMPQICPVKG
jgi:hypothetical protein